MDESQRAHNQSAPQVSPKADAFVDALLRADSSVSLQTALLAINRRASQLPSEPAEARRRLGLVRKALEEATPSAPVTSLPPFESYRRVAAGDLTPRQAGDLWRAHLADRSWAVEWISRLDAYIGSRARPDAESELVAFARAQVEAARTVGDSQLLAMTLTTLGGVTIQIDQHVADGLGFELDALEALRGMDPATLDHYLHLICTNLSHLLRAVPKYDGAAAVLPLARRTVHVVAPLAADSSEPDAVAAAYEALSCAIDEAARAGSDGVEELAERVAAVRWPELTVRDGVRRAALTLAEHLPLRSVQPTLELAEGVANMLGDDQVLRQVQLQAAQTTLDKALTSDGDPRDDAARDTARVWAARLDRWLQQYTQDVPAREVGLAESV